MNPGDHNFYYIFFSYLAAFLILSALIVSSIRKRALARKKLKNFQADKE